MKLKEFKSTEVTGNGQFDDSFLSPILLEDIFWRLNEKRLELDKRRISAIKKWDINSLNEVEELIKENQSESNNIVEKMNILTI